MVQIVWLDNFHFKQIMVSGSWAMYHSKQDSFLIIGCLCFNYTASNFKKRILMVPQFSSFRWTRLSLILWLKKALSNSLQNCDFLFCNGLGCTSSASSIRTKYSLAIAEDGAKVADLQCFLSFLVSILWPWYTFQILRTLKVVTIPFRFLELHHVPSKISEPVCCFCTSRMASICRTLF